MTDLQFKVESIQNIFLEAATTGSVEEDDEFRNLRVELLKNSEIAILLPDFLKTNRTKKQFRQFIQSKFETYKERRKFIWDEFSNTLNYLEMKQGGIIDSNTTKVIDKCDQGYIREEWTKALARKSNDPEGAITTSRTLIETTCKFILDDLKITYEGDIDLPKLYKLTAKELNLAPDQHTENIFKQILGGCQTIVEGLGALRNKLSDSHGKKTTQVKPSSRHAELSVNLAGTMTMFLLETHEIRKRG